MSFKEIISRWPSLAAFAEDIGVPEKTAAQIKWRDSVASKYWKAMVDGAARREISGVTLEVLADLAARRDDAA